jgi:hypothetical protein
VGSNPATPTEGTSAQGLIRTAGPALRRFRRHTDSAVESLIDEGGWGAAGAVPRALGDDRRRRPTADDPEVRALAAVACQVRQTPRTTPSTSDHAAAGLDSPIEAPPTVIVPVRDAVSEPMR